SIETADIDALAGELGVTSKHSLEHCAAKNADAFTTVSPVTAKECRLVLGVEPAFITPNGFDHLFVPQGADYAKRRAAARKQLIRVARGMLNQDVPDNALLIAHSGRYEFKNKGTDLFIESLSALSEKNPRNTVVAYILVPSNQNGVRPEVVKRIQAPDFSKPVSDDFTTHKLVDEDRDPIIGLLRKSGLHNNPTDKVKVVFVPAYLNAEDGALNLAYYDALLGFDLTIFPSYYEPWGYAPLESIAFYIPTMTTSLSGFAQWVKGKFENPDPAVLIVERDDNNDPQVVQRLTDGLLHFANDSLEGEMTPGQEEEPARSPMNLLAGRKLAREISESARWDNLVVNYLEAIGSTLEKVNGRQELFRGKMAPAKIIEMPPAESMRPKWKKIHVAIKVPEVFKMLPRMAKNLWWTWNYEAVEMFEGIDPDLWEKCKKNPNILMERLSVEHFERIEKNPEWMERYKRVSERFQNYMDAGKNKATNKIAYFSMEYGLHESVKIYSGGLGVLAGDYLKQASDDNIDLVGVGLLYRFGYFSQNLSVGGEQLASYHSHNFPNMSAVPVRNEKGALVKISIAFPGRTLHARVWRIDVGRVPLFLLDTDISENTPIDRFITHQLYGGDWENRFKQEFLLGIGGIRLLDALGIKPEVFHCNEGHAAFTGLERLREYVQYDKLTFQEGLEVVRASSLFTTHTPVPAGHDLFSEDMLRTYMPHYAERLGISWEAFMNLGKMNPDNPEENFSMSILASRLSQQINGVSRIHGQVSRNMFKDMYPGFFPEELHIGYVTNGVHYGTWTAPEWQQIYSSAFGPDFQLDISDPVSWEKIFDVTDETIWNVRRKQRKKLLAYIKNRLLSNLSRRQETPRKIYKMLEAIDDKVLTVGFARRFATYKRAHLLFNDLERLSRIVNNPHMPVQFIYAGKAHPADDAGQELIKHINEISRREEFRGKILFLEDYDMELGAALVQGVDVWLNTPTRPLEASGTSGEKAAINGVLNFSVMDGWWAEGYIPEAGWNLQEERTYEDQAFQNELDAETIYNTFETEIVPLFYQRDEKGVPTEWVRYIKNCIAKIAPHYTNKRMMDDYLNKYYNPLFAHSERIKKDHYQLARELSHWKNTMVRRWDSIEVYAKRIMSNSGKTLLLGEPFLAEIELDLNEMAHSDIGVEVVFVRRSFEDEPEIISVHEMERLEGDKDRVTFGCKIPAKHIGVFNYAFRMFPKNEHLPHRQDFNLIKWL
ncbi:MAG: alpha-glucan family phosphorylase, partial [Bacteroidales bacterium]